MINTQNFVMFQRYFGVLSLMKRAIVCLKLCKRKLSKTLSLSRVHTNLYNNMILKDCVVGTTGSHLFNTLDSKGAQISETVLLYTRRVLSI